LLGLNNMYRQGKIYKISCKTTGKIYVGSTTQSSLSYRLQRHHEDFLKYKHGWDVAYLTSFQILENDSYEIELLEDFPCDTKEELHLREKFYICSNECVNKVVPCRTRAEYREDNKDKIHAYSKEYGLRKYTCEHCHIEIGLNKKTRHEKTQRHLRLASQEQISNVLNEL